MKSSLVFVGLFFIYIANGTITWIGTAPFCNTINKGETKCESQQGRAVMVDKSGDGKKCVTGWKTCCCYGTDSQSQCISKCDASRSDVEPNPNDISPHQEYPDDDSFYIMPKNNGFNALPDDYLAVVLMTAVIVGAVCFCAGRWYTSVNMKLRGIDGGNVKYEPVDIVSS